MSQSVLVLGASGYIGQHLVRTLSARGYPVLAAARHIDRLQNSLCPALPAGQSISISPQDLPALLTGIDTLYYLVHGMGEGGDFIAHERRVATYVRDALRQSSVRQVIFLSSLQAPAQEQSDHLRARQITGDLLR
ncbi:NAD dependent epimerase/dehydratase family protein [Klebsiella pneumoniae]|uniref:NAD dependent epimerase/dehydratase family protein n=1 Tax=Klebsiella pneumoniae TaxID=573 RepID=A0A2X3G7F1_KLEPN|nr:NAD dependent epimerase/dehydratase family protein [Klebsiella pneumoniae]